jgi:hypothetical protein
VDVIFKLDAAGISMAGNEIGAFTATVMKKELFGMKKHAVQTKRRARSSHKKMPGSVYFSEAKFVMR